MRTAKSPRVHGFSLIELLIAMTLGLILITGLVAVFAGNKRNSDLNTAMTDMQESARFGLELLSNEIRLSGHQGCLDVNQGRVAIQSISPPTNNLRASSTSGSLVESDSVWSPAPPLNFPVPTTYPAIVGTHTLTLQYGGAETAQLNMQMTNDMTNWSPSGVLWINKNLGLEDGDLAIVANCDTADLFTVSGASPGPDGETSQQRLFHRATHNTSGNLTRAYGDARTNGQTTVMRFNSNVYYIGDTGLTNEVGDRITALYRQSIPYNEENNPPSEVIQGVENMRLAFGIRESGGNLRYVTAADVAYDPERVESVKIGLLMTSWDRISTADDSNTYTLAGQAIAASSASTNGLTHPVDTRFRLVFNTTVKIRNRRRQL